MNQKNVWFIVVTYKPDREVLRRLIAAIQGWPMEVIDNTEKNLGFGGGANKGMKTAFDAGAAWVVVCNQDIVLTKVGIAKFVKALEHCEPGIVGPEAGALDTVRWTTILNGNETKLHKATPCPSTSLKVNSQGSGLGEQVYISGSLMAIHRHVWEATGGFYEPYFMYYEDVDLCVRAKKAGAALQQVKIEGFRHESDASNASKEYYLARNHLLFVLRNAPLSVKLHELLRLPRTLWELWS